MKQLKNNKNIKRKQDWISIQSYTSYIFQTFFRRPFGYLIGILYLAYLAIILLIVPAAKHLDPLFIWNIGGFNLPIFNILFISVISASIAVCVFRTGREDGSDLVFSSKPLTKTSVILIKTFVFLILVIAISIISLIIVALIKPIFGIYDEILNPTGIVLAKYKSLMCSMLIGNLINLLFFGAVAIFVTLFGNQVITMIITFGTAFIMCLFNFLSPLAAKSAVDVLKDKTNSEILTYALPTLNQIKSGQDEFNRYATIQCYTNDEGISTKFDTYEYWTSSKKEAKSDSFNYIDFGKQLSMLYSSFAITEAQMTEATKMPIGTNKNYKYDIVKNSSCKNSYLQNTNNYPIGIYSVSESRGKVFPMIYMLGGDLNFNSNNWYIKSKLLKLNFNTISFITTNVNSRTPNILPNSIYEKFNNKIWTKISDLYCTAEQIEHTIGDNGSLYNLIEDTCRTYVPTDKRLNYSNLMNSQIIQDNSNTYFPAGTWNNLSWKEKFIITSKIQLLILLKSQYEQVKSIQTYCEENLIDDKFPFSSKTIINWNENKVKYIDKEFYWKQYVANQNINNGIYLGEIQINEEDKTDIYVKNLASSVKYSETYGNLYQYKITPFYSIWTILGIWAGIAIILFGSSIIVYKKIDLK